MPLGALSQGGDLLVVGDCGGERRGVRVRGGNAETSELRVDRLDAMCDAGRPLIRQLDRLRFVYRSTTRAIDSRPFCRPRSAQHCLAPFGPVKPYWSRPRAAA